MAERSQQSNVKRNSICTLSGEDVRRALLWKTLECCGSLLRFLGDC